VQPCFARDCSRRWARDAALDRAADHQAHETIARDLAALQHARVAPVTQHNGTVGQRFDFLQTVRDVHDGRAARSQILQHREEAFGLARSKTRRRLVEHQHPRVHRKGAGDRDQLLLRRRQLPHDRSRRDRRANPGELPLCVCLHTSAIQQPQRPRPQRLAAEEDIAGDVQCLDDLTLLMDDADPETSRIRRSVHHHWHTLERDGARVGPMDAAEYLHQRRLARAVLADEADNLSSRHVEVHSIEGGDAGKLLGHRRHAQERISRQWKAPA
jgi:hypothetical protein